MMKKSTLVIIALGLLGGTVSADLIGPLRGTLGPGTFNVVGSIFIYPNDSLTILPGTTLRFQSDYDFDIAGYIYAVGTEQDSIKFLRNPASVRWNGIDFTAADNNSILRYCVIEGSDCIGINFTGCGPTVSRSTFINNNAGGG